MEKNSGFATKQIHTGKIEIPGIAPLATPIFQTSTFEFETTAQGAHRYLHPSRQSQHDKNRRKACCS